MTLSPAIMADSPLHYWPLASAPSPLCMDLGSTPVPIVVNSTGTFGAYSGPASDAWAFSLTSNQGLNSVEPLQSTVVCTAEVWFWQASFSVGLTEIWAWDGLSSPSMNIYVDSNGQAHFDTPGSSNMSPNPLPARTWHQLAVAWDSSSSVGYVDGLPVVSGAGSSSSFTHNFGIGFRPTVGNGLTGLICQAALFSTKLSAARIAAHYAAADLLAYLPVYNGAGSGIIQLSPGPLGSGDLSALILQSVRKTY